MLYMEVTAADGCIYIALQDRASTTLGQAGPCEACAAILAASSTQSMYVIIGNWVRGHLDAAGTILQRSYISEANYTPGQNIRVQIQLPAYLPTFHTLGWVGHILFALGLVMMAWLLAWLDQLDQFDSHQHASTCTCTCT